MSFVIDRTGVSDSAQEYLARTRITRMSTIEQRLHELIDHSATFKDEFGYQQLLLEMVERAYITRFPKEPPLGQEYRDLGFMTIESFLSAVPGISIVERCVLQGVDKLKYICHQRTTGSSSEDVGPEATSNLQNSASGDESSSADRTSSYEEETVHSNTDSQLDVSMHEVIDLTESADDEDGLNEPAAGHEATTQEWNNQQTVPFVSDDVAALECLGVLCETFQRCPWPGSLPNIQKFLYSTDARFPPLFLDWYRQRFSGIKDMSKRKAESSKRLTNRWKHWGCLSAKSFIWNISRIDLVLTDYQQRKTRQQQIAQQQGLRPNGSTVVRSQVQQQRAAALQETIQPVQLSASIVDHVPPPPPPPSTQQGGHTVLSNRLKPPPPPPAAAAPPLRTFPPPPPPMEQNQTSNTNDQNRLPTQSDAGSRKRPAQNQPPTAVPHSNSELSQIQEPAANLRRTFRPMPLRPTRRSAPIKIVETVGQLNAVKQRLALPQVGRAAAANAEETVVAIDCEGVPHNLYLIQVGTEEMTYVFDCVKLAPKVVCEYLADMLANPRVIKLFHDLHQDALALAEVGGVAAPMVGTLDMQLAVESLTGDLHIGFNRMLHQFGIQPHPTKQAMRQRSEENRQFGSLFKDRPLQQDIVRYAADDVDLLMKAKDALFDALHKGVHGSKWSAVQNASDKRAQTTIQTRGQRLVCFDMANSYDMASHELLEAERPNDILPPSRLEVSNDVAILLDLLPDDWRTSLLDETRQKQLSDIVLDRGCRPLAWVNSERVVIGNEDRLVEASDIEAIVQKLGEFGSDNRAGLDRQLHRISAIRNRQSDVIGLTMRVGRHVTGNVAMISDLLFAYPNKSILFVGEPGSGKTTIVREVARLLAEKSNLCIVDTSNEIAGDGDVPHPCVGFARRIMVKSLDEQSNTMIECVQNHTPEVMVIDEIGRLPEVEAAQTCKERGVRLIASAHGDLRKLIKNSKLRGLIGGVETVTLGDRQAREESAKRRRLGHHTDVGVGSGLQKLHAQRSGAPPFEIIVELRRGAHHEWTIILDTADAVDRVLSGEQYLAQRRTRDPVSGRVLLELDKA